MAILNPQALRYLTKRRMTARETLGKVRSWISLARTSRLNCSKANGSLAPNGSSIWSSLKSNSILLIVSVQEMHRDMVRSPAVLSAGL